jgi:Protein of unknown function (DUF3551)
MRILLGIAAAAAIFASIPSARAAGDYCGFVDREHSRVRCGFTSIEQCKQAIGDKDAICIPNPEFAAINRRSFARS